MTAPIRVLVVDDSIVLRRLLSMIIEADPDLELAGIAQNGLIALQRIEQLDPDVVTLDVEMPVLDGLGTLKELRKTHPTLPVVMFSTLTARGAAATIDALSFGASDYVTKPSNVGSVTAAMARVREDLIPKLKALVPRGAAAIAAPCAPRIVTAGSTTAIVAVGSSTGGPNALAAVIESLPGDIGVPIVVTQHMPPVFTAFLADRLDARSALTVCEATSGMILEANTVYIAPGDHHMVFKRRALGVEIQTTKDAAVNYCRPSVDVMLTSVAKVFGGNVLAVILTGMGADGRVGCAALRARGAHILVQDEATSVVWGMPGAVATAGLADDVLALPAISRAIARHVGVTGARSVRMTA